MNRDELELAACTPTPVQPQGFNPRSVLPYSCTTEHIRRAMDDFVSFLGYMNAELHSRDIQRLESIVMPANFSSIVGEFMSAGIPKYCRGLIKNRYHNGHPDLIPRGMFPQDSILHATEGIEIKASRYMKSWQGHNPENVWLMVFVFDSNRPKDAVKEDIEEEMALGPLFQQNLNKNISVRVESPEVPPRPFRFVKVVGALLTAADWKFAGRSALSRRTITASVTRSGYEKMEENWIYRNL